MNIGPSGPQSSANAALIATGSGFVEHPGDTFVYTPLDADSGQDMGGIPHSSGSLDSDGSHLQDIPTGGLVAQGSIPRDASMPTSALNPNYEYALPTSLALVRPEPEEDGDEMLKPSLFDRDAGGYRERQPEPRGVAAAAASVAEARRARHAATVANVPPGRRGSEQRLIDLSTDNASAADASGSQGRSGAGSIGHTPSLASGSGVGNNTAPALGAHREPSLQARSGGVTGSTIIRAPYDNTEDSRRTRVYMPYTQSTAGGVSTEGGCTIAEDAVYNEPSASAALTALRRPREIDNRGQGDPYSVRAPAADFGMATTDVSVTDDGIRGVLKQLDVFSKKDLFLGRFELLGRQQRRRGGAPPSR